LTFDPKILGILFRFKSAGPITTQFFRAAKTEEEREFYLRMSIKENYSVRDLDCQISASLFERVMLGNTNANTSRIVTKVAK